MSGILVPRRCQTCVLRVRLGTGVGVIRLTRPTQHKYFMAIAEIAGSRSTCLHRHQGAVLVRGNRVISTGYNGSPPDAPHCEDLKWCAKGEDLPCRAEGLHAETNAVVSAAKMGISTDGAVCYCIYSPCRTCCNILKSAGITTVRYTDVYENFEEGPKYLRSLGMKAEKI